MLHGGPGGIHDYLLPQLLSLATLGSGFELVFYDQRGGGRSKTDDLTPITVDTHVNDFALLSSRARRTGAPIVGYSWGALLALHIVTSGRVIGPRHSRPG